MATQAAIAAIKIHLPDEADCLGIDDEIISSWIDSGLTRTKTVLASWRAIAAKTVDLEDITESGSSRTQRLHERAVELVKDWQSRADAEDALEGTLPPKSHIKFHTITRV